MSDEELIIWEALVQYVDNAEGVTDPKVLARVAVAQQIIDSFSRRSGETIEA